MIEFTRKHSYLNLGYLIISCCPLRPLSPCVVRPFRWVPCSGDKDEGEWLVINCVAEDTVIDDVVTETAVAKCIRAERAEAASRARLHEGRVPARRIARRRRLRQQYSFDCGTRQRI